MLTRLDLFASPAPELDDPEDGDGNDGKHKEHCRPDRRPRGQSHPREEDDAWWIFTGKRHVSSDFEILSQVGWIDHAFGLPLLMDSKIERIETRHQIACRA